MISKHLIILACFCLHALAVAQDCDLSLQGQVLDYHDKTPLPGATILVLDTGNAVVADLDGNYKLSGLCPGNYEVEVSHPECRTTLYTLTLRKDREFDLLLEHHLEQLEEVRVVGEATSDQTNSAQEVRLQEDLLEKYTTATLGDALRELNGVSTLNTGANIVKPVIHGLKGSRVLVLNEGVRMQDMEWGDEHAPNIDINSAGSVRLVKGAAALQYGGDAIGGAVIMEPKRIPAKDTLYGRSLLGFVSNGRGSSLSSSLQKGFKNGWFVGGQGSFKIIGDREAPDYVLSNTASRERSANLHFGRTSFPSGFEVKYSIYDADIAILRASHIGNVDDLIQSINSGVPGTILPFSYEVGNPRQEVTHHLGKLKYYRRFKGSGKLQLQYDFQNNRRFEYDLRVGDDKNKPSIDLELTTHTLSGDFNWDTNEKLDLHLGVLGRYQDNFANPATGVRRLIPDYEKYELGGFVIGSYLLNNSWSLDAGVRYDYNRIDALKFYRTSRWEERGYDEDFSALVREDLGTQLLTNPVFDYANLSFSMGSKVAFGTQIMRLNYTLAQRPPNPAELFSDGLHHSAARIELGVLRMGKETSHKISMSLSGEAGIWTYSVEPYANFINDFILLEPTGVEFTIRGAFPVWEYRQTNARLLGVDASAQASWTDAFRSEHGFSLVKGTDTSKDIALINMPPANLWNRAVFYQDDWHKLQLSLRSDLVFEQNEFPENIRVFSPEQQEEVLLDINTPPGAYHLLGFQASAEFSLGKKSTLSTQLAVNNVLDTRYRDYLNRQRFFADDLGRNITLQININY